GDADERAVATGWPRPHEPALPKLRLARARARPDGAQAWTAVGRRLRPSGRTAGALGGRGGGPRVRGGGRDRRADAAVPQSDHARRRRLFLADAGVGGSLGARGRAPGPWAG